MNMFAELKFDGLCSCSYLSERKFTLGATRGDGTTGDDVTNNLKTIRSIPLVTKSDTYKNFEVRGEVFIKKDDFIKINEEQELKRRKDFLQMHENCCWNTEIKKFKNSRFPPSEYFCILPHFKRNKINITFLKNLQILKKLKFPVNPYTKKVARSMK